MRGVSLGNSRDSSYSWPDLRDLRLSQVMAPVRSEVEFGTDIPGLWNVQLEADSLIQPGHYIQKETEAWGHVGLGQCHTGQGRAEQASFLFPLLAFIGFFFSFICSHISFIWDLPKYLLNGKEAPGIQS